VETQPDAVWAITTATGINDAIEALRVLFNHVVRPSGIGEVPAPETVLDLLPTAKQLAAQTRMRAGAHRDYALVEIAQQYVRLTGSPLRHARHEVGSSRRAGPFLEFVAMIEKFYNEHFQAHGAVERLLFGIENSGSALERIISALR
jgi:hypothetical protein